MKALSIRQPWAWLIAHGYKDIENRVWPTDYRGKFLIHASSTMCLGEYLDCLHFVKETFPNIVMPQYADLELGGIVGMATLVKCVDRSESKWFFGPYGFVLDEMTTLPFVSCRGKLAFFECSEYIG